MQNSVPQDVRAYHESGHAVAAHVLGLSITILNIHADDKHGGSFNVARPTASDDPAVWRYHALREFMEKFGVMLAAGLPASKLAEGAEGIELQHTAQTDQGTLTQDTMDAFPHPYEDAWIEAMEKMGEAGALDSKTRAVVIEVDERKRKLSDAYYAWLRLRAEALVLYPPHTHAIRTLGTVLMERETLEGNEAHQIIAQALAGYAHAGGDA